MEVSENHESNGPDNSESSVSQEEGEGVIGMRFSDSKDDLFVDASDDLDDARTPDNRESVASNEAETSEEKQDDIKGGNEFVPIDNESRDDDSHLVAELERLRHVLDKTVDERDRMEKEFKEERETLMREMANLHSHLKVLTDKEFLPGEHDRGGSERKTQMGNTPFLELISECSKLLASALELQSQNESAIRELNEVLHSKDQEIEDLNAKITELSVSHDVAASYLNSVAGAASEFQLEKDQYIEVVTDRMLGYLATVVNAGELLDYSISGKISHVENSTYFLIEKYNKMLYEIYQLGQCLSKTEADLRVHEEFWTVLAAARDELLELKRREGELVEKVSHMGQENRKLAEQVEKDKQMVEAVNAELSKTKTELEQEKTRCANTKEKLSMAVTKGKALVQHRDSLKQSLADKTNELEKCLAELQEKSIALQAAELSKEEFVKSNDMVASLQDALLQRNLVLENSEEILSQIDMPEELQSMDMVERVKWLLNERNELKVLSLDFYRLKDAISLMELPETVSFVDLESRLAWLKESFYQARNEANLLLYELDRTKEVARNEIDRLSASLLAELQEKDYIQKELDDLACKYDEIAQKADNVMLEKDQMMKMLLEESGIIMEHQDGVYQTSSDLNMLVYKCLARIREQTPSSSHTPSADIEIFERMQSLLYVKNQELMLSEQLLEEDMLQRLELNNLSNKLRVASEELDALKEEKNSMQKDLERSEEKSVLLREKLSMAVRKGKGLVQDRENLKFQLDEKKSEIEKLRLNLQQQESTISECKDQINRLSTDIERIPMLEADIVATKDQRDQLEQLLLERNNVLHRVVESVDRIVLPVDSVFEDTAGKLNWIARYINECQDTKTHLEQEIGKVKEEASALVNKFSEARATMKSLEDALSVAENKITQLAQEKREIEVVKENVEQELEGAKEEARLQTSKFAAASACKKSLEDELSVAENNIAVLVSEKEQAQDSRADAVRELEKVREEFASQTSTLTEAYKTIKSLEGALYRAETTVALLTEQNNVVQVGRSSLEDEMQKLKNEAESHAVKLADAHTAIKSLEDALLKAKNDHSVLEDEKRIAEQEISTLNSKLNACMEELAGTSGSLENRSVEIIGHLNNLQMLMKDERLLSVVKQCFQRKIENLQDMDLVIKEITDCVVGKDSEVPLNHLDLERNSHMSKLFTNDLDNIEMESGEVMVADTDNISSCFRKTVEVFQMRNKILADKFDSFSVSIDEFIGALLRKLHTTRDEVIRMGRCMESINQKLKDMEVYKQEHEEAIARIESDVTVLLSACSDATRRLQFEVRNTLLELDSVPEIENLNHDFSQEVIELSVDDEAEHQKKLYGNKYVEMAEKLLFSTQKAQTLTKLFERTSAVAASKIQDLRKELNETTNVYEKTKEERDLHQNMVFKLETDVDALKNSYRELSLKVKDCEDIEKQLKEKEAEISSLYNSLSMKEREAEESLLSALQVRTLLNKITGIDVPAAESDGGHLEPESSVHFKKLLNMIYSVTELQHRIKLLTQEKGELGLTISAQSAELEHLKGELQHQVKSLTHEKEELESTISSQSAEIEHLKGELQHQVKSLTHEKEEIESIMSAQSAELEHHKGELQQQVKSLTHAKEELESTISALSAEIEHLEREMQCQVKSLTHEKEELESTISSQSAEIEHLKGELQHQVKSLTHEKEEIESTISAQSAELERRKGELQQQVKSLTHEKEELESTISALSAEIEHLKREMQCQVKSLTHEKEELESTMSAQSAEIEHLKGELQQQVKSLIHEKEELESTISAQSAEIEHLKEVETNISAKADSERMKAEISQITFGLKKIINILGCDDVVQKSADLIGLLTVLEKQVMILLSEAENSKSNTQEVGTKLLASQKVVDELTTKVKLLEGSNQVKTVEPEIVQERSIFETPSSLPSGSEISEVEDSGTRGKKTISPVPSAAHVRTMRKGSTDHLAIDIDSESTHLLSNEETAEDKGHVFKSLNTSGLIPKQGKMIADRIDGIWVSGGRVLMGRPRARLGLIAYWLFLHIWLLGTIL